MAKKDQIQYEEEKEAAASKDAPPESAPETETAGKAKKKSKKDKDENMPKRALSAYLFFLVQKRGEVKEKYPELDNTAAMKQLGMMWKEASDAEKAPFEAMAKEDKERYEEEINQYAKEKEPAAAAASGEDDSKDRYWQPWSVEEDQTLIQAHREGKTHREIAAMLPPGRTKKAVEKRWGDAKKGKQGTAALRAYAAEFTLSEEVPWSVEEDQTFIQAHSEGKTLKEIAAMLPERSEEAVQRRWSLAKTGKYGSAALREYGAENN